MRLWDDATTQPRTRAFVMAVHTGEVELSDPSLEKGSARP